MEGDLDWRNGGLIHIYKGDNIHRGISALNGRITM